MTRVVPDKVIQDEFSIIQQGQHSLYYEAYLEGTKVRYIANYDASYTAIGHLYIYLERSAPQHFKLTVKGPLEDIKEKIDKDIKHYLGYEPTTVQRDAYVGEFKKEGRKLGGRYDIKVKKEYAGDTVKVSIRNTYGYTDINNPIRTYYIEVTGSYYYSQEEAYEQGGRGNVKITTDDEVQYEYYVSELPDRFKSPKTIYGPVSGTFTTNKFDRLKKVISQDMVGSSHFDYRFEPKLEEAAREFIEGEMRNNKTLSRQYKTRPRTPQGRQNIEDVYNKATENIATWKVIPYSRRYTQVVQDARIISGRLIEAYDLVGDMLERLQENADPGYTRKLQEYIGLAYERLGDAIRELQIIKQVQSKR